MVEQTKFNYLNPSILTIGILFVVTLSGCQQVVPAGQRFSSEKGVNVEAFMPADSFLVAKFGTRDQDQLDLVKTLNGYFPNDPMGSIVKEFNQGFKDGAKLDEIGLDFDKDIVPILNNKSQFFFSMSPLGSGRAADMDKSSNGPKVNINVAMTLADEGKFDALLDKQSAKNLLKKNDYNGQVIYSEISESDTTAYLTRYLDTVFLSTNLDLLKTGLDNMKAGKDLLAENKSFQKAMASYRPNLALVYANLGDVIKFLGASEGKNSEELAKALSGTNAENIETEMLILTAEKDGIRLASKVTTKAGVDLNNSKTPVNMQAYLMKKIPAVAPIFYLEGSGLKTSYDAMFKALGGEPDFVSGIQGMKDFLKDKGLDFEKDVLPLMDKGVAIVFEDTGTPIPGMGIYLDGNSNLEGAAKVVKVINNGFDELFAQVKTESPDISMILTKDEVKAGKLWKFKMNLDVLLAAAPAETAKKLSGQKVELYYGMMDDGVMTIALKADLNELYGKSSVLEKGAEFSQALKFVNSDHRGIVYFAPNQLIQLVDTYLNLVADEAGKAQEIPDYDLVKNYLNPLKSMVFSGGEMKNGEVNADFFLHIAQ